MTANFTQGCGEKNATQMYEQCALTNKTLEVAWPVGGFNCCETNGCTKLVTAKQISLSILSSQSADFSVTSIKSVVFH